MCPIDIIKKCNLAHLVSALDRLSGVHINGSRGIDNCVIITIVTIQDATVLYNMFVYYVIIYNHVCQISCGVKRLRSRIVPLAKRRLAPLVLF